MRILPILAAATFLLCLPEFSAAEVAVHWLGSFSGSGPSAAHAVSADGSVVVGGAASTSSSGRDAFRWTRASGMIVLPGVGSNTAFDLSDDGNTAVGRRVIVNERVGHRWGSDGGTTIGPVSGGRAGWTEASGVSNDGSIVVGQSDGGLSVGLVGFRWTSATGPIALPRLSTNGFDSGANAVSGDGLMVVGYSEAADRESRPVRWTSTGISIIGDLPGGDESGVANATNMDGSVIVGGSSSTLSGTAFTEAFRWTPGGGMQALGTLGRARSHAEDVSGDGSIIVGQVSDDLSNADAFVWTEARGMRLLSDVLIDHGVDIGDWYFGIALGVSGDGQTIVGVGRQSPTANGEAFVVQLPDPASPALLACAAIWMLARHRRNPARGPA